MSVLDVLIVSVVCLFSALSISMLHGFSEELITALPAELAPTFELAMDIGFPLLEGASIFFFFFMYIMATLSALRTQSSIEFVGVQLLYGIMTLFMLPFLSNMYFTFMGSSPVIAGSGGAFDVFFGNLPLIGLIFFVVIMIALVWGGKRGME